MSEDETDSWPAALIIFFILVTGTVIVVSGDSLQTDKEVLLNLKSFLERNNRVNQGRYTEWNRSSSNPCDWPGIFCTNGTRVNGVNLSYSDIAGELFQNFSALTELSHLDLAKNTISGEIPADLSNCRSLKFLNLSHNIILGELNLTGLNNLELLDLSVNRISGNIQLNFPAICNKLIVANLSSNNFTGRINNCFEECSNLQYLDLSTNQFNGELWVGFDKLREFSVAENNLTGPVSSLMFSENCNLQVLDLSGNNFVRKFPGEISNCRNLLNLNLWGNNFTGLIPSEIGLILNLQALFLGSNNFSRDIPESLLNCTNLTFLDLSRNKFGGKIQGIFGKFTQVKVLVLHANSYTDGILSSGILSLPNISHLDLSFNNFSGPLPVELSKMPSLKFLVLAYNQFSGNIPPEFGNLMGLQALDLSFNRLNGSIPASIGNLSSLLWLMLANNSLSGEIPVEIGKCSSLMWLNLANNQFSGKIPSELTRIGNNPTSTFEANKPEKGVVAKPEKGVVAGSGECLAMKRWIPADHPPFNFVYTVLTRKNCRSLWDRLLKGNGLFSVCAAGSAVRTFQISGYLQLSGNRFSGVLPGEIGEMQNFSTLHLGGNEFYGRLPSGVGQLPLLVLNITKNKFSGEIPMVIGNIKCLQNLDLSSNNFSGAFPTSLNYLTQLSMFNISHNPLITGVIPSTGQLATFEKESFLGDPLLHLPSFINNSSDRFPGNSDSKERPKKVAALSVLLSLTLGFSAFGVLSLIVCSLNKVIAKWFSLP